MYAWIVGWNSGFEDKKITKTRQEDQEEDKNKYWIEILIK